MILATFGTEAELWRAVARLREEHLSPIETYTPVAPELGLNSAAEGSRLSLVILAAGLFGAAGLFFLQAYGETIGYPYIVGGRPNFSWPSYMPGAAAFALLLAMGAGVLGFLVANGMPRLYEPVDESMAFRNAVRAGWFVAVSGEDAERARVLLEALDPELMEEMEDPEEEE